MSLLQSSPDGDILKCPTCGDIWTHVESIISYGRHGGEDGPESNLLIEGEWAAPAPETVKGWGDEYKVPGTKSSRRHSVALLVLCEGSHANWIHLAQHKGNTFVEVEEAVVVKRGGVPVFQLGDFLTDEWGSKDVEDLFR